MAAILSRPQCLNNEGISDTTNSPKSAQYIDGLVQDCSNSSALAMELLQSCTKPSISLLEFFAKLGNVVQIWRIHEH